MIKRILKSARNLVLERLPPRTAVRCEFLLYHHRLPRLNPPVTFCEKVVHRKIADRDPRMARLTDKILSKEYVCQKLGADWIIPNLWFGETLPLRSERNWPIPFVVKASHGSGWNYFVRSAEEVDWERIETLAAFWLGSTYARRANEWLYTQIQPRLLVEPFVGSGNVAPPDYKFHVFRGQTNFIQVDLGRMQSHRQLFYTPEWKRLPYRYVCPYDSGDVDPPRSLADMLHAAELLGEEFPYIRIDLYDIHGKPKFGEFTFYPNSGQVSFKPERVELELGRLWGN
jgi:hypothetical protein